MMLAVAAALLAVRTGVTPQQFNVRRSIALLIVSKSKILIVNHDAVLGREASESSARHRARSGGAPAPGGAQQLHAVLNSKIYRFQNCCIGHVLSCKPKVLLAVHP